MAFDNCTLAPTAFKIRRFIQEVRGAIGWRAGIIPKHLGLVGGPEEEKRADKNMVSMAHSNGFRVSRVLRTSMDHRPFLSVFETVSMGCWCLVDQPAVVACVRQDITWSASHTETCWEGNAASGPPNMLNKHERYSD